MSPGCRDPGLPLSQLDTVLLQGNSLVGGPDTALLFLDTAYKVRTTKPAIATEILCEQEDILGRVVVRDTVLLGPCRCGEQVTITRNTTQVHI